MTRTRPQAESYAACRRRDNCRLCGSRDLALALSLTPTPLANAFVPASSLSQVQATYPLDVFFCRGCTHLQLLDVVDPEILFEQYVYVSGTSPVFVKHFQDYARDVVRRFHLPAGAFVVDVGSNDGTFLRFFQEAGMKALGIDPAREIARKATESGIETIPDFFYADLARDIRKRRGPAAVIAANNVFAHADDLKVFLESVRELLAVEGLFIFEVSYLVDVYTKTLFDTIYHEHLAYHAVRPLDKFFTSNGMELIEVLRVDTHGGSLRGMAQLRGASRKATKSVKELLELESRLGLDHLETYHGFASKIEALKVRLQGVLSNLKAQGKKIAGFGAPAKMTTLMYHFDLGPDFIDFIVDDSPLKQGLFSPGRHIPILPASALEERRPDYLLVLAWNFAESIMAQHKAFAQAGGHFIVPLPEVRVY